jgi:hypothetical protein
MGKYPALSDISQLRRVKHTIESIDVPEWELEVHYRTLDGTELDKYNSAPIEVKGAKVTKIRLTGQDAALLILAVCDADGKRVFADMDTKALDALPVPGSQRVLRAIKRLNNMDNEADERADENLEQDQIESSFSDSLVTSDSPSISS